MKIKNLDILGPHPDKGLWEALDSTDSETSTGVPHRMLSKIDNQDAVIVQHLRQMLTRHHVSPEALARDKNRQAAMKALNLEGEQKRMKRFPTHPDTRKGNLAEIVLAEYIVSTTGSDLPVYRLRYNPNVEQSMKGDDVLAFDLDSDPIRIIVGEAKFRSTSSKAAVVEIVEGLKRSHGGGIPASLQFVADRLFEAGDAPLGERVLNCALWFAQKKLQLDYVGLLMSDLKSAGRVHTYAKKALHRLALISFGIDSPESIIPPCYDGLEP